MNNQPGTIPAGKQVTESAPTKSAAYTCPMHPEIRQDGPGDCPKCGMPMGTGTDVAMESVRVTLVKGDLRGIVRARVLSKATMRKISL